MKLYQIAQQHNVELVTFPMPENESLSIMLPNGKCAIGMDNTFFEDSIENRVHLAHELGHCVTGSFYNVYAPLDVRQKHEHRADKWAIRELIPEADLNEAVCSGITEPWHLADHFNVTVPFMLKAICYYKYGHFDSEMCFN